MGRPRKRRRNASSDQPLTWIDVEEPLPGSSSTATALPAESDESAGFNSGQIEGSALNWYNDGSSHLYK
jgi:hypothetical protein